MPTSFLSYIMSLGYQATIFLGEVPSPITGKTTQNFKQAQLLIDTLLMLQDKTEGNLLIEEKELLLKTLIELKARYAQKNGILEEEA